MTVTKILGAQAGIQYQGVQDKSEADPRDHLVNALFTGIFKSGPFNKPFKVTEANIRKALGFDPENLQYQAIEDCLKQGAPFVWVMRVDTELKWGPWQLGQDFSILNGIARYTGFKTDTKHAFDSFAEIDLTVAITASLSDSNMQQWQAVIDACNVLAGVAWSFDAANERIVYTATPTDPNDPTLQFRYFVVYGGYAVTPQKACAQAQAVAPPLSYYDYKSLNKDSYGNWYCPTDGSGRYDRGSLVELMPNPYYDPTAVPPASYVAFSSIAQKIISNASSSNQAISLLAETYIQEVAKGLSLEDLIEQFEQNKVKR